MPGFNFQTYINRFNAYRRWGGKGTLPFDATQQEYAEIFQEAFLKIQAKKNIAKTDTTISLSAAYGHTLPTTLMGYKIDSVAVEAQSTTDKTVLERKSYEFFLDNFDLDSTSTTGTPAYWTPSRSSQRQILIGPVPSYTKSNAVHISATLAATSLKRIYKSSVDSITATVSAGATSVTISSGTPITNGNIVAGDEFGVLRASDYAGNTLTNQTPSAWYRISAAAGTTITLTDAFDELAASALSFFTAQVHPVEVALPGVLGFIPVRLALAEWLRFTDPDASFRLTQEAMNELSETAVEDRGIVIPLQNIRDNCVWASE